MVFPFTFLFLLYIINHSCICGVGRCSNVDECWRWLGLMVYNVDIEHVSVSIFPRCWFKVDVYSGPLPLRTSAGVCGIIAPEAGRKSSDCQPCSFSYLDVPSISVSRILSYHCAESHDLSSETCSTPEFHVMTASELAISASRAKLKSTANNALKSIGCLNNCNDSFLRYTGDTLSCDNAYNS